jgi:hypothetical protein
LYDRPTVASLWNIFTDMFERSRSNTLRQAVNSVKMLKSD